MKIGITERGDASLDYSWVNKLNSVDGAILITKNITDKFIDAVLPHKNHLVIHATCTGYGQTVIEPNVPPYREQLKQAQKLVDNGFPIDNIVIRVDPIIPTAKGIALAGQIIMRAYLIHGFKRFRISVLDMYPHVRERFRLADLPLPYGENFSANKQQFADLDCMLKQCLRAYPDISIECCAEPNLSIPQKTGCVGYREIELLGLVNNVDNLLTKGQRRDCLCIAGKTELLNSCHRCKHGCLYCYWKD